MLFAQQSTADGIDIAIVLVWGNLYEIEWYLTKAELAAPLIYQQFHAL